MSYQINSVSTAIIEFLMVLVAHPAALRSMSGIKISGEILHCVDNRTGEVYLLTLQRSLGHDGQRLSSRARFCSSVKNLKRVLRLVAYMSVYNRNN